jgi:hypothetical protein
MGILLLTTDMSIDALKDEHDYTGARVTYDAAIAEGDAALEQRREAVTARATHRLDVILPLFDDVNATRQSLFGLLTQRGVERKRDRRWAAGFFRRGARARREAGGEQ